MDQSQLERRLDRLEQLVTQLLRLLQQAEDRAGRQSQQIQGMRQS